MTIFLMNGKEINYTNIDNEKYRKDTLNDDNPSDIEKFLKIKINYIKLNKEEYLNSFETDFQDFYRQLIF